MTTQTAEPDTDVVSDEDLDEAVEGENHFPCHVAPSLFFLRRYMIMIHKCKRPAMWIGTLGCCGNRYYVCDVHKRSIHKVHCPVCGLILPGAQIIFRPLG